MPSQKSQLHYLARTLLVALPAILIGIQVPTWITVYLSDMRNRLDFLAFYDGGNWLRIGRIDQIYTANFRFIHPPYEALIFAALSFVSVRAAYLLWFGVNLMLLWAILRTLRSADSNLRSFSPFLPAALILAFFPVPHAIVQGQDSLLLVLLVILAYRKIQTREHFVAGLLLGVGAFRFQILLPMAILFLLWKLGKLVAGLGASGACTFVLSLGLIGVNGLVQYLKILRLLSDPNSQHFLEMANVRAVLGAIGISSPATVLSVSGAVLGVVAWSARKLDTPDKFLVAVCGGCLVSYHLYLHDLSLLLLPMIIVADRSIETEDYLVLFAAGFVLVWPIAAILIGPADTLWLCALAPVAMLVALTRGLGRIGYLQQEAFISGMLSRLGEP